MSSFSSLTRFIVLFALVCVVCGQTSTTYNSSSSSSAPIIVFPSSSTSSSAPSTAVSSSSTGESGYVTSSSVSSTGAAMTSDSSSSSSSSSAPMPLQWKPIISSVYGCNSNLTAANTDITQCDGQTGSSVITITGVNFTIPATVNLQCNMAYTLTPTTGNANNNTYITVNTPKLDKVDTDNACALTVVSKDGVSSDPSSIAFVSYATDNVDAAFTLLGLSLMKLIIAVTVIGVVVLIVLVLCTLSCCCGVSLAFLNCCRSRPTTAVMSPQSSGYASMA